MDVSVMKIALSTQRSVLVCSGASPDPPDVREWGLPHRISWGGKQTDEMDVRSTATDPLVPKGSSGTPGPQGLPFFIPFVRFWGEMSSRNYIQ